MRKVASGLLPMSAASKAMPERERRVLEANVAIPELQQVMIEMLHSFREATRGERGRKQGALGVVEPAEAAARAAGEDAEAAAPVGGEGVAGAEAGARLDGARGGRRAGGGGATV